MRNNLTPVSVFYRCDRIKDSWKIRSILCNTTLYVSVIWDGQKQRVLHPLQCFYGINILYIIYIQKFHFYSICFSLIDLNILWYWSLKVKEELMNLGKPIYIITIWFLKRSIQITNGVTSFSLYSRYIQYQSIKKIMSMLRIISLYYKTKNEISKSKVLAYMPSWASQALCDVTSEGNMLLYYFQIPLPIIPSSTLIYGTQWRTVCETSTITAGTPLS